MKEYIKPQRWMDHGFGGGPNDEKDDKKAQQFFKTALIAILGLLVFSIIMFIIKNA